MYTDLKDEELYQIYMDGDSGALEELLARYREELILFLLGYVKNYDDAEDIMMDAFVVIISRKNRFDSKSSFKTWIYGVARNLAKVHIRKTLIYGISLNEEDESSVPDNDTQDSIVLQEEKQKIYDALNQLPMQYREVLYLVFFADMNNKEVSKALRKNEKQVYNMLFRAKQKLKEILSVDTDDISSLM
ncbi:MAG: sigma-70 family RNA polymerase sigma factor [Lachnospiraceae bacterium]|nr:sigma-70 family RNA polymerase sigma factor [Lachnospiraceae bacterium]